MVKIQPSVRPARQDIVAVAREQVLGRGEPLTEAQLVEVLQTPDGRSVSCSRWRTRCG